MKKLEGDSNMTDMSDIFQVWGGKYYSAFWPTTSTESDWLGGGAAVVLRDLALKSIAFCCFQCSHEHIISSSYLGLVYVPPGHIAAHGGKLQVAIRIARVNAEIAMV